jgi:hypothetical protein
MADVMTTQDLRARIRDLQHEIDRREIAEGDRVSTEKPNTGYFTGGILTSVNARPDAPPSAQPVSQCLEVLHKLNAEMAQTLDGLEKTLSPVLRPSGPEVNGLIQPRTGSTVLGDMGEAAIEQSRGNVCRLNAIMERLHI